MLNESRKVHATSHLIRIPNPNISLLASHREFVCVFALPRTGAQRVSLFYHRTVSCTRYEFTTISSILLFTTSICYTPHSSVRIDGLALESPISNVKFNFGKCTYCHRKYGRFEEHETIRSRITIEHHTDRIQFIFVRLCSSYQHTQTQGLGECFTLL